MDRIRIKNYKIKKVTVLMENEEDYTGFLRVYIEARRILKPYDKSQSRCKNFVIENVTAIGHNPHFFDIAEFINEDNEYIYIEDFANSMYKDEYEFIEEFVPHFMEYCEENKLMGLDLKGTKDISLSEYAVISDDIEEGIYSGVVEDIYTRASRDFKRLKWEYDPNKFTFKIKNDFLSKNYLVSGTGDALLDNIYVAIRDYAISWNEKILESYPPLEKELEKRSMV